jgi:hypothetical protein
VRGDLRLLRLAMLGALNWTLQWYQRDGPLGIRELADDLLAVFVPAAARTARGTRSRAWRIKPAGLRPETARAASDPPRPTR